MTRLSIRLVNASIHRRRSSVSPVSLKTRISGVDASGGNTRSHPEHDREEPDGRKYYAGDGMGGQAGARSKKEKFLARIYTNMICQRFEALNQPHRPERYRPGQGSKLWMTGKSSSQDRTLKTAYKINIRLNLERF